MRFANSVWNIYRMCQKTQVKGSFTDTDPPPEKHDPLAAEVAPPLTS
jgi:hypothetical protein